MITALQRHPARRGAAFVLLLVLLQGLAGIVHGAPGTDPAPADVAGPPSADTALRRATEQVLAAVAAHRETGVEDSRALRAEIDRILDARVDFERIARGVMGRHRARATPGQQARFVELFRSTLIGVYTDALLAFDARAIEVGPEQRLTEDRARVAMRVTTENARTFDVHYAMGLGDGGWQVRNLVVDGINFGLVFRNQFEGALRAHRGDVQAVIDGWEPTDPADVAITSR